MALGIEDYAVVSDCHTAALVGRDGSIDWLCLPRYDSPSAFGALLGTTEHGRWLLRPVDAEATCERRYDGATMVLVTRWTTRTGVVEVIDFMPIQNRRADLARRVRGVSGVVTMQQDLRIRFGYASAVPWVHRLEESTFTLVAVAGPDAVVYRGPELEPSGESHRGVFTVHAREHVDCEFTWYPPHRQPPAQLRVGHELARTKRWWVEWSREVNSGTEYHDMVLRSLLVLRALTHEDTGGVVAAATTSLPESFGGARNWDYRYVWLRDASLALDVFIRHGFAAEAENWRAWLLRAIAGRPSDVQIMYGLAGERYLPESVIASLPGYGGAGPVRVGNGAFTQYQADVIGELMVALHSARAAGITESTFSWSLQLALLNYLARNWQRPDNGIWEIRGPERAFTHSRVLTWAAFDRGVKAVEDFGLKGPVDHWRNLRDAVREEIETQAFDAARNTYTQYYGGADVDASLLQLPQVGYCAASDPRMLGTVAAIEHDLMDNGLVLRYRTESGIDGLPPGEDPFVACSFWLVEQYANSGRIADAHMLMRRLMALTNDVGLLSEEYDNNAGRQAGNMPQALSHLALVRAADALEMAGNLLVDEEVA